MTSEHKAGGPTEVGLSSQNSSFSMLITEASVNPYPLIQDLGFVRGPRRAFPRFRLSPGKQPWKVLRDTASGVKIGKPEGAERNEMIWLDPELTSPYRIYQYWINPDDRNVTEFLKLFTFLELTKISVLEKSLQEDPRKRDPHRALAFEFTNLAHGEGAARASREASEILFGGEVREISQDGFGQMAREIPSTRFPTERLNNGIPLPDLLVETKLPNSKRPARDLTSQGGAYMNNLAWREANAKIDLNPALSGRAILLRSGKKTYHMLMVD